MCSTASRVSAAAAIGAAAAATGLATASLWAGSADGTLKRCVGPSSIAAPIGGAATTSGANTGADSISVSGSITRSGANAGAVSWSGADSSVKKSLAGSDRDSSTRNGSEGAGGSVANAGVADPGGGVGTGAPNCSASPNACGSSLPKANDGAPTAVGTSGSASSGGAEIGCEGCESPSELAVRSMPSSGIGGVGGVCGTIRSKPEVLKSREGTPSGMPCCSPIPP